MGLYDTVLPLLPRWLQYYITPTTLTVLGGIAGFLILLELYLWQYREWTLTYRNLRGPVPDSFLWGNLRAIIKAAPMEKHTEWIRSYGPTFRYRVIFGTSRFFTSDPVALSYVLSHADSFPKPERSRRQMADILGNGVLVAEGSDHRRQRKVLNPSFSPAAIREMAPIFYDKAYELKDKLLSLIEQTSENELASPTPAVEVDQVLGARKIDMLNYLGKTTLDVIGLAGFNYDFQALSQDYNELADAYRRMMSAGMEITIMAILQALVWGFDKIPTKRMRMVTESRLKTMEIGQRLLDEKKRAVIQAHSEGFEKGDDIGKDLLSILVKANMASDLRPDQKMSDDEVLAQITTFMLAGNETSSTSLTWTLYALSQNPEIQRRLREELAGIQDDRPTLDALSTLPYLDAVVRESLRLYAPAPSTIRVAEEDCVIPLGTPVHGRDGKLIESVKLKKGATMFIPIACVNTSTDIWGADALTFNPDRFEKLDSATVNQVPGTWGNLLTFLGGARNCIGYRFALAEIKVILFVLLRNLEFEELHSKPEIEKKTSIVMRPRVKGEEKVGLQMPLLVRPVAA